MIHPLAALIRLHELNVAAPTGEAERTHANEQVRMLQAVSPSLHQRYLRIHARHGESAVVPREDGVCTGCHVRQPAAARPVEDAIFQCQNCHRLLYERDEAYELSVG